MELRLKLPTFQSCSGAVEVFWDVKLDELFTKRTQSSDGPVIMKTSVPDLHVVSPARLLLVHLWRDFFNDLSSADVVSSHTCASTLCAALPPKLSVGFYFWEVDDGVDKAKCGEEVLSEDGVFLMPCTQFRLCLVRKQAEIKIR